MTNKVGADVPLHASEASASPRRLLLPALLGLLAIGGGAAVAYAATGGKDVSPTDRAAIEAVVHDYILANPEIIPQAMERLKAKQTAASVGEHRSELEKPYAGAWEGAAQPRVTLVAFMDYACGYCRAALPHIGQLVKDNPDLRVVYRELPIIADGSANAAKVALMAAREGKFMAFHKAMYAAEGVSSEAVMKAARTAGLDAARAKAAIASDDGEDEFMGNIRLAQALKAEGTPLFVVGDEIFNGLVGPEILQAAIEKARDKS